jgi:copper chaperone NosL
MEKRLEKFQRFLSNSISLRARLILIVSVSAILLSLKLPLWSMAFESNQYPDPLRLTIFIDHLEGQKTAKRDDLREINSLNHYIGMRPLLESEFSEFLWMPFVVGILALLALRALVIGSLRDLVDISVVFSYFGIFAASKFYSRLYEYGHNLNPEASIKIPPFTPPFFGRVRIANFWVESFPGWGSYVLALGAALVVAALVLGIVDSRRNHSPGADRMV